MTDILLMIPSSIEEYTRHEVPPLGVCYIAACLQKQGYTVKILDMAVNPMKRDTIIAYIQENKPRVIGISSLVTIHQNGIRIAKLIKQEFQHIPIIMGGPHATCIPEDVLRSGAVDVVNLFEGEATFVEIVRHYLDNHPNTLSEIKGIAYMEKGEIRRTPDRDLIEDLDTLPFPARELIDLAKYDRAGSIITGRGCVYTCKFCAANYLCQRKYRVRSIDSVIEEIEILHYRYGVKEIYILDDTFVYDKRRIIEFCEKMITKGLFVKWSCSSRVNPPIPVALLEMMHRAGCRKISYGVESGNNTILSSMSKGITIERVEKAVRETNTVGIIATCFFIIGFPDDTEETVRDTLEFARRLREIGNSECPVYTSFGIMTPLPGTYYYEHAEELGIRFLTYNWDEYVFTEPVVETRYLSRERLKTFFIETMGIN